MMSQHVTARSVAVVLTIGALPMLLAAPVLSGVVLLHDHGNGLHAHGLNRLDPDETRRFAHLPGPHHEHPHRHDHGTPRGPSPEVPPQDPEEYGPGVLIVVPGAGLAPVPSALHEARVAAHTLADPLPEAVQGGRVGRRPARSLQEGPAPPRRGVLAVLVASHALLI